jgi:hypothetical protein
MAKYKDSGARNQVKSAQGVKVGSSLFVLLRQLVEDFLIIGLLFYTGVRTGEVY